MPHAVIRLPSAEFLHFSGRAVMVMQVARVPRRRHSLHIVGTIARPWLALRCAQ